MPKTKLGKWSVGLIIASCVLFGLLQLLAVSGQKGGESFSDNLLLAIPGFSTAIAGIMAFITGIISIIKSKERSVLVFVSTFIGFLVLFVIFGIVFLSPPD